MYLRLFYLGIFLCLYIKPLLAQQIDYRKDYYSQINKAELAITERRYSIAVSNYKEAFSKVPNVFAKDLFNAAICATLNNDQDLAINFCRELLLKGTEITFILSQKIFRSLESNASWQYLLEEYPALRRRYLLTVNLPIRKEIELMWARDQYFRIKPNGLLVYKDTISSIDQENITKLKEIIKKYNFPGEDLIGVDNPVSAPPFHSILYHHCQSKGSNLSKGLADFQDFLLDAVRLGKLSPHRYATYADIQGRPIYGNTAFYRIGKGGELRYLKLAKREIKKINKRRINIGLEPLGDYRKKVLFSLEEKNFIFDFNDSIIALEGLDSDSIEKFIQNSLSIEVE